MHHALIVGQVEGGGTDAVSAVSGGEYLVHHADGGRRAELRIAVPRIDGQVIFDLLQVGGDHLQAVGFSVVANSDVGFESGLVAEHFVVISFVGTDGDVAGRVEIHPSNIAGVVIVREEGGGAKSQEILERGVLREGRRLTQQTGGLFQIGGVGLVVGNQAELLLGVAADQGEETFGLLANGRRQSFYPGLKFFAGHVFGIEARALRFAFGHAGDESLVVVKIGPRSFVEPEVLPARVAERGGVLLKFFVQRAIAAPELIHKNEVEHACRFHEFGKGLAVSGGKRGGIVLEGDGREAGAHLFELGEAGHNGCGGQKDGGLMTKRYHLVSPRMVMPNSRRARSETVEGASHIRSVPRAVLGNGITSRMDVSPARSITRRSRPRAIPSCGGAPYSRASSRKPKRLRASSSDMPSAAKTCVCTSRR